MKGPPLGLRGEDITWPHQVAPRDRKASSTRKVKPHTIKPHVEHLGQALAIRKECNKYEMEDLQSEMQ